MIGVMRGALIFACMFAVHFISEQEVLCAQGLTRNAERPGLSHVNFVEHLFHYLNVSQVGSSLVNGMAHCAIACLRVVTCFSYNVAVYPDIDGRILCELLASDKYNFSDKFQANPHFHHFTINNHCSEGPCVNGGKCIALYSNGDDFKCECPPGFKGEKCEEKYVSLHDSEILKGYADYATKLNEYLTPVQVSGRWEMCFRASEQEYKLAAFHAACDNKGPTVTLVRVGINVFGGYADKSWNGGIDKYLSSTAAFLFSLKNNLDQQYKMLIENNMNGYAIRTSPYFGPSFGDLKIDDNCNTNANSEADLGFTYSPPNGYAYGSSQAKNFLAGSKYFRCDEYEVFYQL